MVRMMSKRSSFLTKKKKETETPAAEEKSLGFKNPKSFMPHTSGHCKLCHKDVKNFEAHMKAQHRKFL